MDVSRETLTSIFGDLTDQAIEYGQILATTAVERGLIGPREVDRIWDRHIFNSLPLITLMPEGATVIDIGSGAGLPGVVLGLARPDLQITLLEPLERMRNFSAISWHIISGNHDYHRDNGVWDRARALGLPPNVHLHLSPEVTPLGPDAVLLPAPLRRKSEVNDLTEWMDSATSAAGLIRIGLAHGIGLLGAHRGAEFKTLHVGSLL